MASHQIICAVLGYLTAHKWGTPRSKNEIVNRAGIRVDQKGEAKEAVDELRKDAPFVEDHGNKGICIDTSEWHSLAEYLYHRCDWEPDTIDDRLKHYEGINQHEWCPE